MSDKSDEFFEGDENFVRRKIMSDENFVQESLHLQAVLLDKSSGYFTGQKWRKFCPTNNFVRHCFVR